MSNVGDRLGLARVGCVGKCLVSVEETLAVTTIISQNFSAGVAFLECTLESHLVLIPGLFSHRV